MKEPADLAITAAYAALGLAVTAVGALRGLIWYADWASRTKPHHGARRTSPRPPRHPHKESR